MVEACIWDAGSNDSVNIHIFSSTVASAIMSLIESEQITDNHAMIPIPKTRPSRIFTPSSVDTYRHALRSDGLSLSSPGRPSLRYLWCFTLKRHRDQKFLNP